MKKGLRPLVLSLLACCLFSLLPAQDTGDQLKRIVSLLEGQSSAFFAAKSKAEPDVYVGVQYLKGISLILVRSKVDPDNVSFLDETLAAKNYRKVYQDLSMMKGNQYAIIYDHEINGLDTGGSSGDFIKVSGKVIYLNKTAAENGLATEDEYKEKVEQYRQLYREWLQIIEKALK